MLCNQKYQLFLYLLGKCFAPTSPAESLGNRTRRPAIQSSALAERRISCIRCRFGGDCFTRVSFAMTFFTNNAFPIQPFNQLTIQPFTINEYTNNG